MAIKVEDGNSKRIAGLIGPSLIGITIPEIVNIHIWANNTVPGIHLNGTLLFVAGLSVVRAHNHWIRGWPAVVTLAGWSIMFLGLFRMFAPELVLQGVQNINNTFAEIAATLCVCAIGIFLTFKAYIREDC